MASKTPPQTWALDAVRPLAEDLVRQARAGLKNTEAGMVPADGQEARSGLLQPALMLALIDTLTAELEAAGRELVQEYCESRKVAEGLSARKVMETELGPSMGMARASVATAFGYQRGTGPRPKQGSRSGTTGQGT
ncbi:hypothetical protein [Arthrobacter sp. 162MFSha1.1]|uniref:hypothetical protein n=1 Tax=Arthrobacter sp. 162MFSha1.1 TaxID=1151119 RepID=UPI0012DD7948|nr:hypothetical protein [Arthrobacter sp. 162MFSha1.1]